MRIRQRDPLVWAGQVCVVIAVAVAGFIPYSWVQENVVAAHKTEQVQKDTYSPEVEQLWQAQRMAPQPEEGTNHAPVNEIDRGRAFAQLRIPTIGVDYFVVEGVDLESIKYGPGHDPETNMPGEQGNMVVAAHRDGKGSPFNDLEQLHPCDAIEVEDAENIYTYRVLPFNGDVRHAVVTCTGESANALMEPPYDGLHGSEIVRPDQVEITQPVPHDSTSNATVPLLTLYTCYPANSNEKRYVVYAALADTEKKEV